MRVWLLHIGEQLPVDGPTRPFRYGFLARALVDRGHEVLRWAPTFCHYRKSHRYSSDCRVPIESGYAIQFVRSVGYRRNVGLDRLHAYRVLGRRFPQLAAQESPPDIIVAAIPSPEWAEAAVAYGSARGVPVMIDVRDLWPDVFLNSMPHAARPMGRFLLAPYRRMVRRACGQATALTAVSQGYLNWALQHAGRARGDRDLVVPLGFDPEPLPGDVLQANFATLRARGIDPSRPICLFAGLFERSYDLETVIAAARRLEIAARIDAQFVLCGDGSKMPALKRQASGLRNVHFLGWTDAAMLQAVASVSMIGLCAYARDALQSLPNKAFEYMAGGLAIVSSLPGELAALLDDLQCGLNYRAGDAASLASCLTELLNDPLKLQVMRANAYQAWSRNYRSRDIYARFATHLETLCRVSAKAA